MAGPRGNFCDKCKKKINQGEEFKKISSRSRQQSQYYLYHLPCYEEMKEKKRAEEEEKKTREEETKKRIKEQREKAQERAKQEALDKFETLSNECFQKTFELGLKVDVEDEELSVDDYKKIKELLKKLNQTEKKKELNDPLIKEEIKKLQNSLKELEEHASPRTQDQASNDKSRLKKAHKKCSHEQIEPYEDDLNNYYCSYCWDDESPEFLAVLKRKGINPQPKNNDNNQQKQQLQQAITNLENKSNCTPEEEKELENKKKQLADLENEDKSKSTLTNKPTNYTPWIIGGGCLLLVVIIFLVWNSRKKNHRLTASF